MTALQVLTMGMAASLACNCTLARPVVLGVVSEANRAHLNTGAASAGTTVYDGDRFSTEAGGMLLLQGNGATLQLAAESEVIVKSRTNGVQGIEAELNRGTLAFSSSQPAAVEIVADEARVRPVREEPTIGQVTVIGPKELLLHARRGALQFSHRGETQTIAEGKSYRVILDPSEDDAKKNGPYKPARQRKTFLFIAVAGGAVGAGGGIYESRGHKHTESPDRP